MENKLYRYLKMEPTSERFGGKRFDFDPMITWRTLGMQENDELEFILDLERVGASGASRWASTQGRI